MSEQNVQEHGLGSDDDARMTAAIQDLEPMARESEVVLGGQKKWLPSNFRVGSDAS